MKKVLYITNIPTPYRIDFLNELGKRVNLTAVFEAKQTEQQKFNWKNEEIKYFSAVFLSEGNINERKVDWTVFKRINFKEYDEIIVTNYSYATEMMILLYLKIKRIPHHFAIDGGTIHTESTLKKWYKSFLLKGGKSYMSPSDDSDLYLMHYGVNKKKIYRYPFTSLKAVDVLDKPLDDTEKQKIRTELGIHEKIMILGVGQFIYRKGWDIFLNSLAGMDEEIGVYIIGGVPTQEYISLVKKNDLKNIHFFEFKTSEELSQYYKAADIFVLLTREDIWGLVINEAMSYGLPVITSDKCIAGLALVEHGKNGYILSVDKPLSLLPYVSEIYQNRHLMSTESLRIIQGFTIENMADCFFERLQ